ncbi:MAG: ParA family protein [Sedimentisphaerales bacterium]|nr:ParA family protein [Sedimentisphaerales bacterium]
MRTIAMVNQKGGCGKTTTSINTAAALAERGKRVLLVDLDPQAHATIGLGHDPDSFHHTVYDVIRSGNGTLSSVIVPTNVDRLDLAPCNVLLASAEMELARISDRQLLLSEGLRPAADLYDLCVIDCPPSLGVLTFNALVASTEVVVPVQAHYYALEGLKRLLETVRIIRERFHPESMEAVGLLLTFVEERSTFSRQIQQEMRDLFGDLVFDTVIHRSIRLAEAPSAGESVLTYAPHSRAAADHRALACELLGETPEAPEAITEGLRRGIQKHLVTLFSGVWIPKAARSYEPGTIEST